MTTSFSLCAIKNANRPAVGRSLGESRLLLARRSLTQHSRPRRPDRLFSPNQVEVLQKERQRSKSAVRMARRGLQASRGKSPAETHFLCLPVSPAPGDK